MDGRTKRSGLQREEKKWKIRYTGHSTFIPYFSWRPVPAITTQVLKSTRDTIFTLKLIISTPELIDGARGTINHKVLHSIGKWGLEELRPVMHQWCFRTVNSPALRDYAGNIIWELNLMERHLNTKCCSMLAKPNITNITSFWLLCIDSKAIYLH